MEGEEEVGAKEEEDTNHVETEGEEVVEISLYTLRVLTNSKIIKLESRTQDNKLMILIDSRSTHSFKE